VERVVCLDYRSCRELSIVMVENEPRALCVCIREAPRVNSEQKATLDRSIELDELIFPSRPYKNEATYLYLAAADR
jgi:hypothetical protein